MDIFAKRMRCETAVKVHAWLTGSWFVRQPDYGRFFKEGQESFTPSSSIYKDCMFYKLVISLRIIIILLIVKAITLLKV